MDAEAPDKAGEEMTFDTFWSLYPRKVARKDASRAWSKLSPPDQALALETLPAHIKLWAETTTSQFIPYPATWLNGERFHDEIEMPQPKTLDAWWTSEHGVLRKGQELGILPKPGEDSQSFRNRVIQNSKRAA